MKEFIDAILEADQRAPRKQRHTAHRIYVRIEREKPEVTISESTVRRYSAWKKRTLGCAAKEVCIAQKYAFGEEAQVDRYEASAEFAGDRQRVNVFCMRSMASGAAFHCRLFPRHAASVFGSTRVGVCLVWRGVRAPSLRQPASRSEESAARPPARGNRALCCVPIALGVRSGVL
ncbi:MAG: hypothetical protein ACJ746_26735 [Bryobacteraceae bacterium]